MNSKHSAKTLAAIYADGYDAFENNLTWKDNPYGKGCESEDKQLEFHWNMGWSDACEMSVETAMRSYRSYGY